MPEQVPTHQKVQKNCGSCTGPVHRQDRGCASCVATPSTSLSDSTGDGEGSSNSTSGLSRRRAVATQQQMPRVVPKKTGTRVIHNVAAALTAVTNSTAVLRAEEHKLMTQSLLSMRFITDCDGEDGLVNKTKKAHISRARRVSTQTLDKDGHKNEEVCVLSASGLGATAGCVKTRELVPGPAEGALTREQMLMHPWTSSRPAAPRSGLRS